MRVGHGFDAHRFIKGDHLFLAGVKIAHYFAVEAHSDGDVILHALCDALLGAAGLGDIGDHFPPTDPQYKDMDSRQFVRKIQQLLHAQQWRVANVDITLVAQMPRIKAYKVQMEQNIAEDLGITLTQVNVKATTTEKMGYLGREEGIAAYAVALLLPV
ncbi:MAG TPA: 2-C-methyl-D-erythritol 2,4-cyclodiphosphate synthase [Gammaproteobacteria bacterium]|nr:2-C-methyl-D-erythritol 2,4-cyclodiphosphate synthase [Gammaproteobacteria bacterium]